MEGTKSDEEHNNQMEINNDIDGEFPTSPVEDSNETFSPQPVSKGERTVADDEVTQDSVPASEEDESLLSECTQLNTNNAPSEAIPVYDPTKFSDDGYTSESYYSSDTTKHEVNQSLLSSAYDEVATKNHHDDIELEAGYALPEFKVNTTRSNKSNSTDIPKQKHKSLRSLICGSTYGKDTVSDNHQGDDAKEKYYNPPVDIRDNYFLPPNDFPIIRVLLSLTVAMVGSFTALFLLIISLSPLLSFVISFVLFFLIFVIPMTLLYHQGVICVTVLLVPSMFSARSRVAICLVLSIFILLGPIVGIADKLNIAASCGNNRIILKNSPARISLSQLVANRPLIDTEAMIKEKAQRTFIHAICISSFENVTKHCHRAYSKFQRYCKKFKKSSHRSIDEAICAKTQSHFCRNDSATSLCTSDLQYNINTADEVRLVVLYLLPILVLILLQDAYNYNKLYLTRKYYDNIYITQRLKEFDNERRKRGLSDVILPLTRIEFQRYLVRGRMALSKIEKSQILKWLGIISIFAFISLCFIILEDCLHNALLGFNALSPCKRYYIDNTTAEYRNWICIIHLVLFLTIMFQSYMLRLRSLICDKFYPDMVDVRARHMYYKILHDRNTFKRHIRRKIQLLAEAKRLNRRMSCKNMVYHVFPSSLKKFCRKCRISRCMICDSLTYKKTVECSEKNCRAHYCFECFVDSGQQCLTCNAPASPALRRPDPL